MHGRHRLLTTQVRRDALAQGVIGEGYCEIMDDPQIPIADVAAEGPLPVDDAVAGLAQEAIAKSDAVFEEHAGAIDEDAGLAQEAIAKSDAVFEEHAGAIDEDAGLAKEAVGKSDAVTEEHAGAIDEDAGLAKEAVAKSDAVTEEHAGSSVQKCLAKEAVAKSDAVIAEHAGASQQACLAKEVVAKAEAVIEEHAVASEQSCLAKEAVAKSDAVTQEHEEPIAKCAAVIVADAGAGANQFVEPLPTGQHAISKRVQEPYRVLSQGRATELPQCFGLVSCEMHLLSILCPLLFHFMSTLVPLFVHFLSIFGPLSVHFWSDLSYLVHSRFPLRSAPMQFGPGLAALVKAGTEVFCSTLCPVLFHFLSTFGPLFVHFLSTFGWVFSILSNCPSRIGPISDWGFVRFLRAVTEFWSATQLTCIMHMW